MRIPIVLLLSFLDVRTLLTKATAAWNEARRLRDLEAFIDLHTDDVVLFPIDKPPVRGRKAIRKGGIEVLFGTNRPMSVSLTLQEIYEQCGNEFVYRQTGIVKDSKGNVFTTNGVGIMALENGIAKIKVGIWNRSSPKEEPRKEPRKQSSKQPWKEPSHLVYRYNDYYHWGDKSPYYYNYPRYRGY